MIEIGRHVDTTSQHYRFQAPGGDVCLPRVSRVAEALFGPMYGDRAVLDAAATFGTSVHSGLAGEPYPIEAAAHVNQGKYMLIDNGITTTHVEPLIFNLIAPAPYAGRADRIGVDRFGFPGILDWKTGVIQPRHRLAINLYSLAWFTMTGIRLRWQKLVHLDDNRYQVETVPIDWGWAVRALTDYTKKQRKEERV